MKNDYFNVVAPIALIILFYGGFFIIFIQKSLKRLIYKRFFRAVISVLRENTDLELITAQIKLNFKKLSEKNPNQKDLLRNPYDLLEEMIYYIDTYNIDYLKKGFNVDIENSDRPRILAVIELGKERNPYLSLPPKEANLLHNIRTAMRENNIPLVETSLKQLSDEIEITESNLRVQVKRNYSSYIVSIVGVILTIFFGILSLISVIS